jgi:hypothetical protein
MCSEVIHFYGWCFQFEILLARKYNQIKKIAFNIAGYIIIDFGN